MFGWLRRRRERADPGAGDRRRGFVPPFPAEYVAAGHREPERRAVVRVTPAAAVEIRRVTAGLGQWVVRVQTVVTGFDGIAPAGFQDRVDVDNAADPETDYLDETQGIPVVVDRRTAAFLGSGVVLDWGTQPDGRIGFALRRPER